MTTTKKTTTKSSNYYGVITFTYFIPAPPKRKNGYRELELDEILSNLLKKDYDLLEMKTQSCVHPEQGGMWIICLLGAKNKKAANFNRQLHLDVGPSQAPAEEIEIDYE